MREKQRHAPEKSGISPKNLEILKKNSKMQLLWLREWVESDRYFELLIKEYNGNKEQAAREWKRRKEDLGHFDLNKNIHYVRWMYDGELGRYVPFKNPLGITKEAINNTTLLHAGNIAIAESATHERYAATPIHEMTHRLNDSGEFLLQETAEKIHQKTKKTPEFASDGPVKIDPKTRLPFYSVNHPTEWIARLEQLRYLLDKEGIYDPKDGDFTEEHIRKSKKNKTIQQFLINDSGIFDNLAGETKAEKYENLLWFLNNIADNRLDIPQHVFGRINQNLTILHNRTDIG